MLMGPAARAREYIGRHWAEYLPHEWVQERVSLLRSIEASERPVLLRTIWRGHQTYSWITPMPSDEDSIRDVGVVGSGARSSPLFLFICRRTPSNDSAERVRSPVPHDEVDSNVVGLGPLSVLSQRELEVLALLGQGLSVREAAEVLCRSEKTIENHRASIHDKLGVGDRVALAEIARRAGLGLADSERKRV